MAPLTRRSRRVAGLAPSSTVLPAPLPAPTPKKSSFRRTSARAENTPKRVVTSKKRTIYAVPETSDRIAKRPRPSTSDRPVATSPPKATTTMPTTEPEQAFSSNFSSTFRAPSPNNPADWSSDDDEDMNDEDTMKTGPVEKAGRMPPVEAQNTSAAVQNTPKIFHNSFRAPSPNNPDDWSSDDEMTDDERAVVPETEAHEELLNTPCPKAGSKKFGSSHSGSLTDNNTTTTLQGQSIFDKAAAHTTTTNTTSDDENTPVTRKKAQTPESESPHVTYIQRTPAPQKLYNSNGRVDMSVGKQLMHSNFIGYIEGEGVNIKMPINQQIVDDFNRRAPMHNEAGEKVQGLELEMYGLSQEREFEEELKEFDYQAIKERAEREMDVDTLMGEEEEEEEEDDVDIHMNGDKDEIDFELEKVKMSSMSAIVDNIPEDDFEDLY